MVGALFIHNFAILWQAVVREELMSKAHVVIYSRPGCHLCEEAKAVIQNAGCSDRFTLEEIDIESDHELLRKYKYDIPVIAINGVDCFMHRVEAKEFETQIKPIKSGFKSV